MIPHLQLRLPKPHVASYQVKGFWLVCILFLCISSAFAQDIIYTTKGDQIKCKVETIGEDSIYYHKIGASVNAPPIALIRGDIFAYKLASTGITDTVTPKSVKGSAKIAVNTPPATNASGIADAVIFTTDGKQIACKVTLIDETDGVTYLLAGNSTPQKIAIKSVMTVKSGTEDLYDMPGLKPGTSGLKIAKKVADDAQHKDTLSAILQNWSRNYPAPPLEIF